MITAIKNAYAAGSRAGMANAKWKENEDGTKTIAYPECPLKGKLERLAWNIGFDNEHMKKLSRNHKEWMGL